MRCAVIQPSYIPWRGFFDLIRRSEVFVFYDDVQFDRRGWRNRNRIKTANGPVWLTIPVRKKGSLERSTPINEIEIAPQTGWNEKHLRTLSQSYARAPFLEAYLPLLTRFLADPPELLAELTIKLTVAISRALGFDCTFVRSSALGPGGSGTDRLLNTLELVGATHYLSGPSARAYIEPDQFERAGIELAYIDYDYRPYPQLHPPYDPQVSIVDLLFMCGPEAANYFPAT